MYENQTSMHHKLFIIGAGAAGLMAAVTAQDQGIDTAILESNDRIGKKILMTGDGRCNITNESTATGTDEAVALSRKYHSNQIGFQLRYCSNLASVKPSIISLCLGFRLQD